MSKSHNVGRLVHFSVTSIFTYFSSDYCTQSILYTLHDEILFLHHTSILLSTWTSISTHSSWLNWTKTSISPCIKEQSNQR